MVQPIRATRVNHPNAVVDDYDVSLEHFRNLFGAHFLHDLPGANWHACLIEIGNVIFEIFAPPDFMLNSRFGGHFLGIEYQTDLVHAREVVAAHGIRVMRDIVEAIHTHPADAHGVSFEFWTGSFHANEPRVMDNDIKPIAYWTNEHPLGMTGMKAYTIAPLDFDKALALYKSLFVHEVAYDEARAEMGARAVGLKIGDVVMEVLGETGPGRLQKELQRYGQGIRSIVWGVKSLDQAKRYFAERGVEVEAGSKPGRIAVPAEANRGLLFEFEE